MKRKDFLKKGAIGISSIVAIPVLSTSCGEEEMTPSNPSCPTTPTEIEGPFPIKTPADLVRENIIGNRSGIPLQINFTIQDGNNNCMPLANATVDLWQCDAKGNYSEYDGQLDGDFTNEQFLRGRQRTDANGQVSFISIYPGWYPGRAPHLHLEVKDSTGKSLLITQVAFPEDISNTVYSANGYNGSFDTSNTDDDSFSESLEQNLPDNLTGNNNDGYVYNKTINVVS